MAIVSDVEIRLRADIARLQQDMTAARRSVGNFTSEAKNLLKGFAAGFSIIHVIGEVVKAQREFDKMNSSLITATGSSKNAAQAMAALQKLAATTPFSIQEVTEGFLKLRNLGLTPSEKALISYGNTASAMGKSLNQMVEAVADAATGEFERLKEFGIKAKQNGDKVSLTFQGTTKTIGNNAAEIEKYLMAIGDVNFAGGMERQAATLDGALSNLGDTWSQTLTAFSQSGFGDVVQGSVLALTGALSDLGAMFKAVSGAASEEGGKVKEIGPLHKFLTTIFETITVLGTNVSYVFKAIGGDIGAFAAQVAALFRGGAKGIFDGSTVKAIQEIGRARVEEGKAERAEVDATSKRILEAADKNQKAQEDEAAARAKGTKDALAQYKIKADGVKQLTDAQKKELQAYQQLRVEAEKELAASKLLASGKDALNAGQKLDADLTDDIRLKKVKLNKEQEKTLRNLYAQISANNEAVESQKRYKEMQERAADDERKLRDERAQVIQGLEDEAKSNEMLVLTFGKTTAAIAAMEVARLKEQLAQRQGGAFTLDEIEQLEKVIALKERSAKALAAVEEEEKARDFWTDVDRVAHDTFTSIADGGKGMWQRLRETGKNMFFDWLYQMSIKKWIINIGASMDGSGAVSGIAGAANAIGAGGGIASTLGNLYSAVSGGMTLAGGLGSGFMGSLAGGLNGAGVGSGLTSALGLQLGNSIASVVGPSVAGALSSGLGALAAAAPWVAGAVAVFTLAKKAFGMGPKEFSGNSTLSGTLTGSGVSGNMLADWTKKGGWFRSDQHGVDRLPVDAQLAAGLVSTYKTIQDSTTQYAKALGLNADNIANRSQALNIAFTKDDAANQKAISDFFTGVADDVAREVLPELAQFQQAGETVAQTMQRLATNAAGVDQILAAMGTTTQQMFGAVGGAAIAARERLLQLVGGLDALATQTTYFYQNFYTDADRALAAQKPLQDALAALGFAGITTTEQFKDAVDGLVKSGAVATEEGAKQYAGLLALAPQYKMVADYLKGVSDAAAETAKQLADAKAELLAKALGDNEQFLRSMLDNALSAVGRAVEAQKNRVTAAFEAAMAALDASISRVNDTISKTGELSKALKGAITAAPGDNGAARYDVARAQISAALAIAKASGVLPTPDSLAAALQTVTQDNADNFETLADYQRAVARTNAELEALGGLTDDQLDTAQMQLELLQAQKDAAQVQHEADLAALDAILSEAQAQVDSINGVNNSVLTVARAVLALQASIGALQTGATPNNPTGTGFTVEDLYRTVLGREGEAAGVAFWKNAFGDVIDQSEYLEFLKGAQPELKDLLQAPPDVPTSSGTMSSSNAMLLELQTLNSRMANVEDAMGRTATSTGQFASQFNQVSGGGNSLAVEAV